MRYQRATTTTRRDATRRRARWALASSRVSCRIRVRPRAAAADDDFRPILRSSQSLGKESERKGCTEVACSAPCASVYSRNQSLKSINKVALLPSFLPSSRSFFYFQFSTFRSTPFPSLSSSSTSSTRCELIMRTECHNLKVARMPRAPKYGSGLNSYHFKLNRNFAFI